MVAALRDRAGDDRPGFLANAPAPDVIRIAPPLILSADQAAAFVAALGEELNAMDPEGSSYAALPA